MALQHLKKVRVAVSLILFLCALSLFLDFADLLPPRFVAAITMLQVVPSILRALSGFTTEMIAAACILLVTLVFGRVYCSSICPLGTLQDAFSRLNRGRNSARRFRYRRQTYLLHYGLFLLAAALAAGGSMFLLYFIEPFSTFGRLASTLLRPVAIASNNGIAAGLAALHSYAVFTVPFRVQSAGVIAVALVSLGVLFLMSYSRGRLFCNTLCPAGALLGLVARFSLVRITIDRAACRDCSLCEKVCKAGCIDSDGLRVDFNACVACFNCFDACPTVGLRFRRPRPTAEMPVNRRRRHVLRGAAGAVAVMVIPPDTVRALLPAPTGKSRSRLPVAPPGSGSIERFTSRCTACHLCVSKCPTQVLTPAFLEYGPGGVFQPRMDYSVSPCTYECVACGEVCPTGAILPLAPEAKKLVQIGKAKFVKDDCIVVTKKTECGACSEHCPTKAVHMIKSEGHFVPEVNEELCIGCGSCEHPCPSTPNKAIYVEANPVHLTAKKPESTKPVPAAGAGTDFPF